MEDKDVKTAKAEKVKADVIGEITGDLSERARNIVKDGHTQIAVMESAFVDVKLLGDLSGIMSIMSSGTLNENQIELAKRIAVKVIAVLGMVEANKKGA